MQWSAGATLAINDTKKTVLRRKVMLNIIIDSYAWYDRIFRYSHMTIALVAPLVSFLDQMINGSVERTSTSVLILSSVVAGMLKLKDYLKFDKLKDQAKQQTIKYQQLYQRIEREVHKSDSVRQNEEDFIAWITRELSIIEVDDPDIPQSLKEKYIKLCKDRGIPYDEDLDALGELFGTKIQIVVENAVNATLPPILPIPATPPKLLQTFEPPTSIASTPIVPTPIASTPIASTPIASTPNTNTNVPTDKEKYLTIRKQRSPSDEADRQEYRERIKTLDTSKDLDWAIERLNNLS